jgi:hypothetical protein
VVVVQLLGGPAVSDADFTTIPTWAIAHGQLCAYPQGKIVISPLYPFLSGGIAAVTRIGGTAPFPHGSALGPHCNKVFVPIQAWSIRSNALTSTLRIGFVGWLALLAGIVTFLRTTSRGRSRWEPATLVVVACLPPVWFCLQDFFHPQDLTALGLALGAMACARTGRWAGAGVLVTVAILSQPFALLVAAPLLVLAPATRRLAFVGAGATTALVAATVLLVTTSRRGVEAALLGSGDTGGLGTALDTLHLHGASLLFASRVLPVVLALILTWWVVRRLGPAALEPVVLVSVVALSLCLRLVFEQALFGYYFMALAVTLVLLDVIGGRIRGSLVAWLTLVSLLFIVSPGMSFGFLNHVTRWNHWQEVLTLAVIVGTVLVLALRMRRGLVRHDLLVAIGLIAGAVAVWPSTSDPLSSRLLPEEWQIILVLLGVLLAAIPLADRLRREGGRGGDGAAGPQPAIPLNRPRQSAEPSP